MDILLNDIEVRILGCLIEKEMATPEYYPLSLNSLTNACNQKTNRFPVVSYDEATVERGLNSLRDKGLTRLIYASGSRVPKFGHAVLDKFDLSREELAVLSELMLRGPQTPGEIRARAERMTVMGDIGKVEQALANLAEAGEPLVVRLPREAGRKESRYMHLLAGKSDVSGKAAETTAEAERIARLEEETALLRKDLEDLRQAFERFSQQF